MWEFITPDQMRAIEERAERLGVSRLLLMENAGKSIADYLKNRFGDLKNKRVIVIAGLGNNGGDGFAAARHLAGYGASVGVFLLGKRKDIRTPEASLNWSVLERMGRSVKLFQPTDESFWKKFEEALGAGIIVDAIFGTGIKGKLTGLHASAIEKINSSGAFKLAVDVPSGLDPSSGEVCGPAIRANVTITFHKPKVGLRARKDLVGEIVVANIGIPFQ